MQEKITTPATFETVWAALDRVTELQEEGKKSFEEFKMFMQENEAKYERRMKLMEKTMGSWGNNYGSFAEEYFFNCFEEGQQTFFGEHFDDIERNYKSARKNIKDEYDIVLFNEKSVGIIEIKFKAHKDDIAQVLRKAETFRFIYPDYEKHKVYLGLASMSFYPDVEEACIKEGIAIIKQVGDTVVINDDNLKVF